MHTSAPAAAAITPTPASPTDAGAPAADPTKPGGTQTNDTSTDSFSQALAATMGVTGAPPQQQPTSTTTAAAAPSSTTPALAPTPPLPPALPPANSNILAGAAQTALADAAQATPPATAPAPAAPAGAASTATTPPSPAPGTSQTPTPPAPSANATSGTQVSGVTAFSAQLTNPQPVAQPSTAAQGQQQTAQADATGDDAPPVTLGADASLLAPPPAPAGAKPAGAAAAPAKTSGKTDSTTTTTAAAADTTADADHPVVASASPRTSQNDAGGSDHAAGDATTRPADSQTAQSAQDDSTNANAFSASASTTPAPIQTTTAAATGAAGQAIASQLATQVVKNVDGKSTSFNVALDPAGLGHVDVKVDINAQGQVTAQFSFDNAHAAAEAKSQSGQLQQALEQAGFNVSQGGLSFDVGGQGAGLARQDAPPSQTQTAASTPTTTTESTTPTTTVAAATSQRPSSGVDIKI